MKIVKSLRNLKILTNREFLKDKKLKMEVANMGDNIIEIDSDDARMSSITSSNNSDFDIEDDDIIDDN